MSSYVPIQSGLHELALTPGMQQAVMAAAQRGAEAAKRANPGGNYTVTPEVVQAGRRNENRAGAVVADEGPDSMGREAETRALTRNAVAEIERTNQ